MAKVKVTVQGVSASVSGMNSFIVILQEDVHPFRRLPIVIGHSEASSIAATMENVKQVRPMTHDLFKAFAQQFDATLDQIVIDDLKDAIFYAKLYFSANGKTFVLDCRPSDAIALAVRYQTEIFVMDHVINEAGISSKEEEDADGPANEIDDLSEEAELGEEHEFDSDQEDVFKSTPKKVDTRPDSHLSQLEKDLTAAIQEEDYERAAKIRDLINKLKS